MILAFRMSAQADADCVISIDYYSELVITRQKNWEPLHDENTPIIIQIKHLKLWKVYFCRARTFQFFGT